MKINISRRLRLAIVWALIGISPIGLWSQTDLQSEPQDNQGKTILTGKPAEDKSWTQEKFRFGLNTQTRIPEEFFSEISLQPYLEMFLENVYDHAIYQLPAMGGYSYPDNYVFSLLGNSWLWNRYYIDGHNINDPFLSGYSLHRMPMYFRSLEIDSLTGELNFLPSYKGRRLFGMVTTGYLGPRIPYYKLFKDSYSQQSPQLRDRAPTESRRRNRFTLELLSRDFVSAGDGILWIDAYANIRDRIINDFDQFGNASPYNETFLQFTINGKWKQSASKSSWGWLATYITRDQLFSEFYFRREEAARLDDFTLSLYYDNDDKLRQGHILHLGYKGFSRHNDEFSHNLFNLSGEGLDPYYPSADVYSIAQHSSLRYSLDAGKRDFFGLSADIRNTVNVVSPRRSDYVNPVFFKSPTDYLSLYVTEWTAKPLGYILLDYQIAFSLNRVPDEGFQPYGEFGLGLSGIGMNRESFVRVRPYFTVGMNVLNGMVQNTRQQLRIEIGRVNIPFDNELALFISDLYQTGKNYVWNDDDQDGRLDDGEMTSELHSTTGGGYRQVDAGLNQPHYYYLDIPYNIDFDDTWSLSIAAHYRIFKDQLWVRQDNPAGSYVTNDGVSVFIPAKGEKHYTVYNLSGSEFPGSPNWFNDSPFYMGMAAKVTAVGEWYFFSLSIGAYLVNGITTLGNGPLHNSQGTLAELMGDPNAAYRNLGRLDSDRAYVGKLLLAFRFLPELIGVMDFKYRDGQPIGQWNYYVHESEKQVSFIRNSVSGDNILLYNGEFGTREDALISLDLRFQYTWEMNPERKPGEDEEIVEFRLNFYNLIDSGRELVEFSFFVPKTANRNALELQVPRGIEFSVNYRY